MESRAGILFKREILVVGGGPGGAITATLLAREGMDVRLIERERFPRYHIGESLAPSTRAILDLIGVSEELDRKGFQKKRGGVFRWGKDAWTIDWIQLFGDEVKSWQVDRDAFDAILLDKARESGVQVTEEVTAKRVSFTGERPTAVHGTGKDGRDFTIDGFDHLIDASGRYGLLSAKHLKNRRAHQRFRNVAIWGYWKGGRSLPGTPEGGTGVISTPEGWWWVIPLAGERTSVGFVTHKDVFARRRTEHRSADELYHALLRETPVVQELTEGFAYIEPTRVETDYSYVADRFSGPGYMMVGDAACFLDPLLSTGAHLAVYSGFVASAAISSMARGEVSAAEGEQFFEMSFRRAYSRMLSLVSFMYDQHNGRDDIFGTADRLAGNGLAGDDKPAVPASFGEIIAGLTDMREASDAAGRVRSSVLKHGARGAVETADGHGGESPDFKILHSSPAEDDAVMGLRLVTEPRLGLGRVDQER
ncbi:NAD(P)/FAD-dependent oxidoreductase [Streptomyces flaveolus]|uniref:NAD(P)/FAD-dependent oxidoreductase n=1 Tax=Streptomyces flaveolus TaxID=67297 RepID=UPI0036FBFC04